MAEQEQQSSLDDEVAADRRAFLSTASSVAMTGGLVASYGTLAFMAGRFLYPEEGQPLDWFFVAEAEKVAKNQVVRFHSPAGHQVTITRVGDGVDAADFLALSTVCPHLGCQVHWEPQHDRFFCPCHNGVFSPTGEPVSGPPAEARQPLPRFHVKVDRGLLFVQMPARLLA